ncbi:MAG: ATP-binding protein, partial [Nitrospiraceae bacterium]|nr:ATP-binding protein [Nitrospiraceae bacterium]
IKQVWMNILMNACQAMGPGGSMKISTWLEPEPRRVAAAFSDSGSGIPREIQGRIFDPFFTTKEPGQGTGLGLAVSYGIIKEHGGEITFETEEGKGATFKVSLPIDAERA